MKLVVLPLVGKGIVRLDFRLLAKTALAGLFQPLSETGFSNRFETARRLREFFFGGRSLADTASGDLDHDVSFGGL